MISTEVQRTLVKSPPELWAELSDQEALARHLGELGEIRITKIEPEQTVEWEAEAAKGRVHLKPSGWGTKVTLSVTQELPNGSRGSEDPDGAHERSDHERAAEAPEASETQETIPECHAEEEATAESSAVTEPHEPAPEPQQTPRPGFFARLFRRGVRLSRPPATDMVDESVAAPADSAPAQPAQTVAAVVAIEPEPTSSSEIGGDAKQAVEQADLHAELAANEEALEAQTTELLSTLLDRLGRAHHRPFSRT